MIVLVLLGLWQRRLFLALIRVEEIFVLVFILGLVAQEVVHLAHRSAKMLEIALDVVIVWGMGPGCAPFLQELRLE